MVNSDFWQSAVIYQIYPRSFKDSNGDGIGDLNGILQKLDYLLDLGVNAVWISPMYKSPMIDFGYDVSDYCDIDPMFGTLQDMDTLIKKLHDNGMKIIMDYIPSHTSIEHPWFIESASSKNNPKRNWYIWKDPKPDGAPPNNWHSLFGGSAWQFDEKSGQYYLHSFAREQADLNWHNPEVKRAMFDVLRFWMDHGVDGFRIDAYNHIFKHAEYKDVQIIDEKESGLTTKEAVNMFMYMKDQEEMFGLVKEISNLVCNQYGKYIATETYAPLDVLVRLYKSAAHRGYTTLNFSFLDMVWDAQLYKTFVDEFDAKIGTDLLPTYVLGNHDRERLATRIGLQQARASVLLLLTLRGIPYIYQGDELGMENVDIPVELLQDPWAKNFPGQKIGRDPVRTPFQWDNSPNAGFTEGTPWLPIAPDYQARNVKKESEDPTSMYNLYKKLLKLRKESEILIKGTYESLGINNKDIFAYTRKYGTEILIIAVNFSNKTQPITLVKNHGRLMCSTYMDQDDTSLVDLSDISLRPYEGCLYKVMHAA